MRLEPHRHARRIRPGDAAAQNDDLRSRDPRHAAEQDAETALLFFETMRANLHRHASCDFTHRRQKRQSAEAVGHGLVCDAHRPGAEQDVGQRPVGGEMQVGEQYLVLAQRAHLIRLGLLDLDDHLGRREYIGGARQNFGAGPLISAVIEADAGAGAGLDDDLVPVMHQFPHTARNKPDPVFVGFDLFRHADQHSQDLSRRPRLATASATIIYSARFRDCQPHRNTVARIRFPKTGLENMEILVTAVLCYFAIGAAFFAYPASPAVPNDFHWRSQIGVFRASLPEVLAWPLTLWRFCRTFGSN